MLPEQVRLPVAPSTVQPVAPEPPARFTLVAVAAPGPMLMVVAAPKRLPVRAFVLKREAVPVEVVTMLGLAPFIFNTVAFDRVTVGLAMVAVPEVAPRARVVAAPPMFSVVALALKSVAVAPVVVTSAPFTAMSPEQVMLPVAPSMVQIGRAHV